MKRVKEGVPQYHSAVLILNKYPLGTLLTREEEIGIFWRLMGKTQNIAHNNQEKPYMFYFKTRVNPFRAHEISSQMELHVSSIESKVIEAFISNVRALIEAGEAVDVQGTTIRPLDVFPVKDLDFIGEKVCLVTETGCCCCKRIRTKSGKRSRYYLDPRKESDVEEWKAIIARKLAARTKMFMGVEVPEDTVSVDIISTKPRQFVNYKSANLPTDFVQIEVSAPSPAVFTAIYGGIGSHTGAGFGAVRVAKKKLKRGVAA